MKRNVLFKLIFFVLFLSLGLGCRNQLEEPAVKMEFSGEGQELVTNSSGEVVIHSYVDNNGNEIEVNYNIKIVDPNGNPVENMRLVYNELNGKSMIYVYDEDKKYSSFFVYGTPEEISQLPYAEIMSRNPNEQELKSTEIFGLLAIGLVLAVGYIGYKEVQIALEMYEVQKFYLTDYVESEEDYILYCKDFNQIAELIQARTNIALAAGSILTTFVSAGAETTMEITGAVLQAEVEEYRDVFLNLAIDIWGMTADELVGRKVAVKVYPVDEEKWASNVRNIFAYYRIELDNPACGIEDVPDEVNNFMDNEDLEILESMGMDIYKGLNPPDIEGIYFLNSLENYNTDATYTDYTYRFYNQTSDLEVAVQYTSNSSEATGSGAFISGDDNFFTVYCETDIESEGDAGNTVYMKTAEVYSGKITYPGIANFKIAFIVLEKENDIYGEYMDVGDSRVIYESDNLAEEVYSFPYSIAVKSANNVRDCLRK